MIALEKSVLKLKRQVKEYSNSKGAVNAGDVVTVDYFSLDRLLRYFDETQEATQHVLVARNALAKTMFNFSERKARKGEWPGDL